jgi:FixJ family two-component response regulator
VVKDDLAVIVVDDDPSILRALRRLLRAEGFAVVAFESPGVVLTADLPKSDACLLIDVHMPEMSGVKLCQILTASGCSLPVILMSGHLDGRTTELMEHAGAVATLTKPFNRDALIGAVKKALAGRLG